MQARVLKSCHHKESQGLWWKFFRPFGCGNGPTVFVAENRVFACLPNPLFEFMCLFNESDYVTESSVAAVDSLPNRPGSVDGHFLKGVEVFLSRSRLPNHVCHPPGYD